MTPPIRFAVGTGAAWIGLRTAALLLPLPWWAIGPDLLPQSPRASFVSTAVATSAPSFRPASFAPELAVAVDGQAALGPVTMASLMTLAHFAPPPEALAAFRAKPGGQDGGRAQPAGPNPVLPTPALSEAAAAPPTLASPQPGERGTGPSLTGSAWLFLRGGPGGSAAAPGGELGGSQAGARLTWRPAADVPLGLTARVSTPTGGTPGAEAALGLAWQPAKAIPVTITAERRVAIDRGGRNAWGAFAAGGLYDKHLPGGLRLDGYAEAGVVGARRGDLFADGGVRVGTPVALGHGASVTAGGGVWGAAQPHVARLDAGPQAVVRVPVGGTTLSAAADWRFRLAGDARPRSGPALTVGVDF